MHLYEYFSHQETYSDVTIACGGRLYPAHKFVLSACSEYLRVMLCAHPNKHPILYLKVRPWQEIFMIKEVAIVQWNRACSGGPRDP